MAKMRPPLLQLSAGAKSALQAGRVIEAIKITRQDHGLDLNEARDLVEGHLEASSAHAAELTDRGIPPEATILLHQGNRTAAIRIVREAFRLPLKDAHDIVGSYIASNRQLLDLYRAQRSHRIHQLLAWAAAVVALGAAAVLLGHP
jgi:ribosomal protein L7/L12